MDIARGLRRAVENASESELSCVRCASERSSAVLGGVSCSEFRDAAQQDCLASRAHRAGTVAVLLRAAYASIIVSVCFSGCPRLAAALPTLFLLVSSITDSSES